MSKWPVIVEPSILSADFGNIASEVRKVVANGADAIHIDIMDGLFVPNITFGPKMVAAVNRSCESFLDVHLMIYNPFEFVERFIEAGADRITFHIEATEDVEDTLNYIRKSGVEAGLAISPDTSPELVVKYLDKCDLILVMTVNPGFGGQEFMPETLEKVEFLRKACDARKIRKGGRIVTENPEAMPPFDIQVDGGINAETAKACVQAGANVLVSGNYLFSNKDMKTAISGLRGIS